MGENPKIHAVTHSLTLWPEFSVMIHWQPEPLGIRYLKVVQTRVARAHADPCSGLKLLKQHIVDSELETSGTHFARIHEHGHGRLRATVLAFYVESHSTNVRPEALSSAQFSNRFSTESRRDKSALAVVEARNFVVLATCTLIQHNQKIWFRRATNMTFSKIRGWSQISICGNLI